MNENKVNHFLNNLEMVKDLNEELNSLHADVQRVKDEIGFKIFCICNFNENKLDVNTLREYFLNNKQDVQNNN